MSANLLSAGDLSGATLDFLDQATRPAARPVSQLDAARFEQLLAAAQMEQTQVEAVGRAEMGAPIAALSGAVDKFGEGGRGFVRASEEGIQRLTAMDPTDPRALVTVMEVSIGIAFASAQMKFAFETTSSTKDSLKTLLMSQG